MAMTLKDHLKLFLADTLTQVFGYRWDVLIYKLLGLKAIHKHILRERRKMTRALWLAVMRRYNWRCVKCGLAAYGQMQVDHIVSLFNWGRTEWNNLQVLCRTCNRQKGTKYADYRT